MSIFAHFAAADGAGVVTVLFLRYLLATLVLGSLGLYQGIPWPQGRPLGWLILLGGLGMASQSLCFFTALTLAPAGLVALLLYLFPSLVTAASLIAQWERPTPTKLVALALATGGLGLTVGFTPGGNPWGIVLGLMAAVIYAANVLGIDKVLRSTHPLGACTVMMASAAFALGILMAFQGPQWPSTPVGWGAVGIIGLGCTTLGFLAFFWGVQQVGAITAALVATWEPVVTLILGAIVLGQPCNLSQLGGGALILGAVALLSRQNPDDRPQAS